MTDGTRAHLITALWEYVLYLEICYKLLEKDQSAHKRDHKLYALYTRLAESYATGSRVEEGDFSERLFDLSTSIKNRFEDLPRTGEPLRLRSEDVTKLIYLHDLHSIREQVAEYLRTKNGIWILFDNLDKGWPAQGIGQDEIIIIRCLIDAAKKIQRELTRRDIECHNIVFIRNDVFEMLMSEGSDFGKEARTSLDWSGKEFLREVVRSRLAKGGKEPFETVWGRYFVSHIRGEDSYYYLEQRTLMRPRNIIKIISHCKGDAIVRNTDRIDEVSIDNGLGEFSNDIVVEADREISDIEPLAKGLVYQFIREPGEMTRTDLNRVVATGLPAGTTEETALKIVNFLMYFGFIGVKAGSDDVEYIYDFRYNMSAMTAAVRKAGNACLYCVHPAFWPALKIGA